MRRSHRAARQGGSRRGQRAPAAAGRPRHARAARRGAGAPPAHTWRDIRYKPIES
ncbi:hypothetical protein L548_2493 [Bordetella pertussis H921]|nr:hypothetical protein L548_2493 [Bordetella pertussis H921]